ncbi:conserved Plasmodium protein, unknown function [Plasmodium ovale]|uniref:U3 small nucleolar RNA-associated protein 20 domain-containing protein n=1 Tax=Plasmodium ovale TaxID=36330 RepID=A0A1D3TM21_PLAOA|nr:conserved Plasmodium protein, unknown function [Plasmodium ovale]
MRKIKKKRSLINVKLKLKNKKKEGHFVSFYDRIKEIAEKEKLQTCTLLNDSNYDNYQKPRRNISEENGAGDLQKTNFYVALQEYPKNCFNSDFRKCCKELLPHSSNLMLILLKKDKIFSTILRYIRNSKIKNDENYFYKLLVQLIKDLKEESKKYIQEILTILNDKININNLDLLEEIFNSYANIFRIMNRSIIKNIGKYMKISLPLLQHRNNIIKIFFADSFSYLLRKLSLHNLIICFQQLFSFFNFVQKNKLKNYSETISLLMLEALKVDKDKLSRKTFPFLKYIIYSIFLKEKYYCNETEICYEPLMDINQITILEKTAYYFFLDIYNFTKKGTFEFLEIFLTFILKMYSSQFAKYYSNILLPYVKGGNEFPQLITEKGGKILLTSGNNMHSSNEDKNEYILLCNRMRDCNDQNVEKYIVEDIYNEMKRNENISGMEEEITFVQDVFYRSTNFFLKKILSIWIEKNNERKGVIIETVRCELIQYAKGVSDLYTDKSSLSASNSNRAGLNYAGFLYLWSMYDNVFFLLNHDSVCNEDASNAYISFVDIFMNILKSEHVGSCKNGFANYLLHSFVIKLDKLLIKKGNPRHDNPYFISIVNYIFLRLVVLLKCDGTHLYEGVDLLNDSCHRMYENISLEERSEILWNEINSFNITNLYLGKIFILCDILISRKEKDRCTDIAPMFINTNGDNNVIRHNDNNCSGIRIISKRMIMERNTADQDYSKSVDKLVDKSNGQVDSCNAESLRHPTNVTCFDRSPVLIQTQVEDLFIHVFDKIKKTLVLVKKINEYANMQCAIETAHSENNRNEFVSCVKSVLQFLFASVNLLSEVSTFDNALLCTCLKRDSEEYKEKDSFSMLHSICDNVVQLKGCNFLQGEHGEKTTCEIRTYVNCIVMNISSMITNLSKNVYSNTIREEVLSNNSTFLLNFLSKWDEQDIHYCDTYLGKVKRVITDMYESNYFENRTEEIFFYLKIFKKFLPYYETISRKQLLEVIRLLVGIYIEVRKYKNMYDHYEDDYKSAGKVGFCEKVLSLFDCMIYLENEEYLSTHVKIYQSKILDIINYLTVLKKLNIFKEYFLKICTKISIIELIMLLNVRLVSIPKEVIFNLKAFLQTLTTTEGEKCEELTDCHYNSQYYFYILKCIHKISRQKLHICEEVIKRNVQERVELGDSTFRSANRVEHRKGRGNNEHEDAIREDANQEETTREDVTRGDTNEDNTNEGDANEDDANEDNTNENDGESNPRDWRADLKTILAQEVKDCEESLKQYLCKKKDEHALTSEKVGNFNAENSLKNVLYTLDLLIIPLSKTVSKSYRIKMLDVYMWIVNHVSLKCVYYINEFKYYKLVNVLFDIMHHMNNILYTQKENGSNIVPVPEVHNELNALHTKSISSLVSEIQFSIKTFVSSFTYNMQILRVENLVKFINILSFYDKKLNNYKNDIEEILSEKSINFTKLLLNIKEEDKDGITPILVKIIFCLLKNRMKKGNYKMKKNIIFYMSSISKDNYCHILIPIIYSFTNVYKNKVDYNNLVRYEEKENILLHFLNTCQGNFSKCWNYQFDVHTVSRKNGRNKGSIFSYEDILNQSYWSFNSYIIEIKKNILLKNSSFTKSLNLFIGMLKIMKYKLSAYLEFFFHIFVTILHYINSYCYMKKKLKRRRIFVALNKMYKSKRKLVLSCGGHGIPVHGIETKFPPNRIDINHNNDSTEGEEHIVSLPNCEQSVVEFRVKDKILRNIHKKCVENIQFIMRNFNLAELNLQKSQKLFTFLFYKNLKNINVKSVFLDIPFTIWCKNELYYDCYNSTIPNSILILIKAINNDNIVSRMNLNDWDDFTDKVFCIILRLCGYSEEDYEYEYEPKHGGDQVEFRNRKKRGKRRNQHTTTKNEGGLNLLHKKKNSHFAISKGIKILKPYICDIILCIKKTVLRRYKHFILRKDDTNSFNKKRNMKEVRIITNKELYILIELSSINKNQIYNIHLVNIITTFMLINSKSLHNTTADDVHKIKLTLTALKRLLVNISKEGNELTRRKNNFNFSFHQFAHTASQDVDKKNKNSRKTISSCSSPYGVHKLYICYKLRTLICEVIQRCYDVSCRILAGELLIIVGCIFMKIKNIEKYIEMFKKNVDLFIKKTNNINYNSKCVLKYITKIPLRSEKIKQNEYYTFLQIAQIFCGMNICGESMSSYEYDADVQFLILLDMCNVKIGAIAMNYLAGGIGRSYERNSERCDEHVHDLSSDRTGNDSHSVKEVHVNETQRGGTKQKKRNWSIFTDLLLNSNKMFLEILIRHCLFLIFDQRTNEMVVDKSVQFVLFFTKLLQCLLQMYEKKGRKNGKEEKLNYQRIERDIKIYIHFVVNIIIPKALNALRRNINEFTKISLQMILTASKNICPHVDTLKLLDIGSFLRKVNKLHIKNYVLGKNPNSLFCFIPVRTKRPEGGYSDERGKDTAKDIRQDPSTGAAPEETNFRTLEKLLFCDLYHYAVSKHGEVKHVKRSKQCSVNGMMENIIDLKSENNLEGVKMLINIASKLSFYTISKIVIPISLNYIFQAHSKKEIFNKTLSLSGIKLLCICSEKVGLKIIYNLLVLLLSELKKNTFNKSYIEKAISHLVRAYHFREFQNDQGAKNSILLKCRNRRDGGSNESGKIKGEMENRIEANQEQQSEQEMGEEGGTSGKVDIPSRGTLTDGNEKRNVYCEKFIERTLPQLKHLMFDKTMVKNAKKKKNYINDLFIDYKSKDTVAKPDIIISYLVILNKMNYKFEKELHKIIYKLCFCLSSIVNNVRAESKKALCYISMYLGLNYFDLIIRHMSDYLTKGYHIPIFLCTVNSILESVLYEKEKFLNNNYLRINFNVLNESNMVRASSLSFAQKDPGSKEFPNICNEVRGSNSSRIDNDNPRRSNEKRSGKGSRVITNSHYDNFCNNIFNMIKLEIINEIEKNTEDVNKKKIKKKTIESRKMYGSNIIKLLTNIVPGICIENNMLPFLESLFSGDTFENNEVDRNFIFKKKYIFIVSTYFNDLIKGMQENKNLSPNFMLNIVYKLLIKSIYFFKGDSYENLLMVMKNSNLLFFNYDLRNEVSSYNQFKKSLNFNVSIKVTKEKYLGYNYNKKCIQYPEKKCNLDITQGEIQGLNIYDSVGKSKKYDFKVHAQVLARVSLKLLSFLIRKSSQLFCAEEKLDTCKEKQCPNLSSTETDKATTTGGGIHIGLDENAKESSNSTTGYMENRTTDIIRDKKRKNVAVSDNMINGGDVTLLEHTNSKMYGDSISEFVQFIRIIEPLLVYCFCYGKEDVFILSSTCIKNIKKKKYSNFNKFGKLIILSSVDILKNIPNYYSKEFDKLILSCIDTLTYLIKYNNSNDFISWLNSDISNGEKRKKSLKENSDSVSKLELSPRSKRKLGEMDTTGGGSTDEESNSRRDDGRDIAAYHRERMYKNINKGKKQIRLLLNENVLSTHYNREKEVDEEKMCEETINSLRYCLINEISLLLESKNHVWEILLLLKNCLLREDINNYIRNSYVILKINSCIDQIFKIMIEESYNLKLSFLCGQIYIDFLMRFPISEKEKKKKFFQIINNLDDENDDSRIAILNCIYLLINRINSQLLKEKYYYTLFACFLINFTNENNPKCKKMYIFLISLLFEQVNDLNYVFNSYKIVKNNLSISLKTSIVFTYLYLLPIFTSIFYKKRKTYHELVLNNISELNNVPPISKENKKRRKEQVAKICQELIGKNEESDNEYLQSGYDFPEENTEKSVDFIRIHFSNQLLKYNKNNTSKERWYEGEKAKGKKKKNCSNREHPNEENDTIFFMKYQLEDLFLSLMFHLIGKSCVNLKSYMKEDKNAVQILTSSENITFFCNHYSVYEETMDKDMVYLFYKTLEQIFLHVDISLVEKILQKKCVCGHISHGNGIIGENPYGGYAHDKYMAYFQKNGETKCANHENTDVDPDDTSEKLLLYFLYFWNLILGHGLFNANPYVQIISLKILMNYINDKFTYSFMPLLLVKLYFTNKFVINIIIKKLLSLLLNSYLLEHFYIYHKEISFFLSKICKLLVIFPWITNGLEEENNSGELNHEGNSINSDKLNSMCKRYVNTSFGNFPKNGATVKSTTMGGIKRGENNGHLDKPSAAGGISCDADENDDSEDEEFKRVNTILLDGLCSEGGSCKVYGCKNGDEHGECDSSGGNVANGVITQDIRISKEMLSYSKFFLIIITLSRAINLHLKNKKKSFTRILTILHVYKNIILDFPPNLWNPDNGIIINVITPLYTIASISKKKYFVEDECIFEETSTHTKFLYLSRYAWDIISLLEEKLQNKKEVFIQAFVQTRRRINQKRFNRKKINHILAVKHPKLYTLNKLKKREKKKIKKRKKE